MLLIICLILFVHTAYYSFHNVITYFNTLDRSITYYTSGAHEYSVYIMPAY